MARALVIYINKNHPHATALASEITKADVDAGRGGVVGDFWVSHKGFKVEWHERDNFLKHYEKLKSPRSASDDDDRIDAVAAEIEALAPAPAPIAEPMRDDSSAAIAAAVNVALEVLGLPRRMASLEDFIHAPTGEPAGILARLVALEATGRVRDEGIANLARTVDEDFIKIIARVEAIETGLAELEKALGVDANELAAAAEGDAGDSSSSSKPKTAAKKRAGGT